MFNDKLDFTVGGFYFKQDGTLQARVDLNYAGIDFIHGPDPTPSESIAAFLHTTWHLTDATNLSLGARHSDDTKEYTYFRRNPNGTLPQPCGPGNPFAPTQPPNCVLNGLYNVSATFEGTRFDWRVSLDHRFSDSFMGYAQVSTGYKGGGVNPRPFTIPQIKAFEPETLTTFETGFKSDLFDRRLRINGAVFFNKYKDIILTLNRCPGAPCAQPNNVGEADVKGAELEVSWRLGAGFSFDASVSKLDFEYTDTNVAVTSVTTSMITPFTPEVKSSLGVQWDTDLGTLGTFMIRGDVSSQSEIYAQAINAPTNRIGGYSFGNVRAAWRGADEDWEAAVEVTNVTDKLYFTSTSDGSASSGTISGTPSIPRAWALTIKRNF
jgi:iron complex outermembrane receptor protein